MKKTYTRIIFTGIALMIMLLGIIPSHVKAATTNPNTPELSISFLNQDPDPAEPGNYFKVRFKVENIGLANANNVDLKIVPNYPFDLYQDSDTKTISSISARQTGSEAVYADYNLKVDEKALPGAHQIDMMYRINNGAWTKFDPITVNVKQHEVVVSLSSVSTTPESVKQGDKFNLKLNFENLANTPVKYLNVKLGLVSVLSSTTSVTVTELPFSPVSSSNEQTFELLNPGQQITAGFNLIVDSDAVSKVYKIPVTFSYNDPSNNNYTKQSYISIVVGDTPELTANIDSSEVYKTGMQGKITVKFVNKGLNDIKFLYAALNPAEDYTMLSPIQVYVGKVSSDDYQTIDYELFVKDTAKDKITLPLMLEYKDINNNEYVANVSLDVTLYSSSEAQKLGLEKQNLTFVYVIVLVLLVAGYFFYRGHRKKKKASAAANK